MSIPKLDEILVHYPEIEGIHPAANVFPLPNESDFETLCHDMRANGLLHSLLLTEDNKLVDGKCRLLAAYETHTELRFERTHIDPWMLTWSLNGARCNLTPGQKAAVACAIQDHFEAEANERQQKLATRPPVFRKPNL